MGKQWGDITFDATAIAIGAGVGKVTGILGKTASGVGKVKGLGNPFKLNKTYFNNKIWLFLQFG